MTYAEYLRDTYKEGIREGEARGEARGIEIGEARGEIKGAERQLRGIVQTMLQSMSVEQIAAIIQKPIAEIQAIANSLPQSTT